ncbi:hypothetical protein NKR23_g4037 [Pleurostoma richardsiae]|uniref:F-box domain-containing protein n=1 Tax=Pleurostoma richardsiae TaxID=41990 RepID=A0AA38S5P7_9PEZI|nr:hypothetical protein NKR23_g4037 [Pleurostoma richardsiae]
MADRISDVSESSREAGPGDTVMSDRSMEAAPPIHRLPSDIMNEILPYLTQPDLRNLAITSKAAANGLLPMLYQRDAKSRNAAIFHGALHLHLPALQEAVRQGAPVNIAMPRYAALGSRTPLTDAIQGGDAAVDAVEFLLRSGADPRILISVSAREGKFALSTLTIALARADRKRWCPAKMVRLLLKYEVDSDGSESEGEAVDAEEDDNGSDDDDEGTSSNSSGVASSNSVNHTGYNGNSEESDFVEEQGGEEGEEEDESDDDDEDDDAEEEDEDEEGEDEEDEDEEDEDEDDEDEDDEDDDEDDDDDDDDDDDFGIETHRNAPSFLRPFPYNDNDWSMINRPLQSASDDGLSGEPFDDPYEPPLKRLFRGSFKCVCNMGSYCSLEIAELLLDLCEGTLCDDLLVPAAKTPIPRDIIQCLLNRGADPNLDAVSAVLEELFSENDPQLRDEHKISQLLAAFDLLLDYGVQSQHCKGVELYDEVMSRIIRCGWAEDEKRVKVGLMRNVLGRGASVERVTTEKTGMMSHWEGQVEWTPLLKAVYHSIKSSREPVDVQFLLEEGADPNYASDIGETPLITAVAQRAHGFAWLLLEHGAKVNQAGCCALEPAEHIAPLVLAVENDDYEMVRLLLRHGAAPNGVKDDRIPLQDALEKLPSVDDGIIRLLIEKGAHVNYHWAYRHPLEILLQDGVEPDLLQLFLDKGLSVRSSEITAQLVGDFVLAGPKKTKDWRKKVDALSGTRSAPRRARKTTRGRWNHVDSDKESSATHSGGNWSDTDSGDSRE